MDLKKKNSHLCTYTTYIRPIAEYVSVVWHSSITAKQSALLERQQTRALPHIYGFGLSTRAMLERSGLELLSVRRERACSVFAWKCVNNERFRGWFPRRPPGCILPSEIDHLQ